MTIIHDAWAEARTQQFRAAMLRLREMSIEVDELAIILDDSGGACTCCGAVTYRNFTQKKLREKVSGAATSLRGIAEILERRARDPGFVGDEPGRESVTINVNDEEATS